MGEGDGFCLEGFAQALRHNLGIAEIAHGWVLCFGEREIQTLALLRRSLGAKEAGSGLIHSPYPKEGASSGSYPPGKNMHRETGSVNCG